MFCLLNLIVIIMLTTKPRCWTCAYHVLDALCLCYESAFLIIVNSQSFRKFVLSQAILERNVVVLSLLTLVALLLQMSTIQELNEIYLWTSFYTHMNIWYVLVISYPNGGLPKCAWNSGNGLVITYNRMLWQVITYTCPIFMKMFLQKLPLKFLYVGKCIAFPTLLIQRRTLMVANE